MAHISRALLLVLVLPSVACMGSSYSLRGKQVSSVEISVPGAPYCPGSVLPLALAVNLADGKKEISEGYGKGRVSWDELRASAVGAKLDDDKLLWIPQDAIRLRSEPPEVTIGVKGQKDTQQVVRVPLRYNCAYLIDVSGRNGASGSAGFSGSRGRRAGDGSDGFDGHPGKDVMVNAAVTHVEGFEQDFLEVEIFLMTGDEPKPVRHFLVDTNGGTVVVKSNGGHGGKGGDAGRGDYPFLNGRAGRGGRGGDAGNVMVRMDPNAHGYRRLIRVEANGGRGGNSGSYGTDYASGGGGGRHGQVREETEAVALWVDADAEPSSEPPATVAQRQMAVRARVATQSEVQRWRSHPFTILSAVGAGLSLVPLTVGGLMFALAVTGCGVFAIGSGVQSDDVSTAGVCLMAPILLTWWCWPPTIACLIAAQLPTLCCSIRGLFSGPQPYWHYVWGTGFVGKDDIDKDLK